MSYLASNYKTAIFALLITLVSCSRQVKTPPENMGAKTFVSPAEAGAALVAAAEAGDRTRLLAIVGPKGEEILFTGDAAQDKANLRDFVTSYTQMNRWEKIKAGGETLYIGPDNYAFPIPLGKTSSGRWFFDTAAGKDEILARRIGKNELTAIAACEGTARAQQQYLAQTHDRGAVKQYAKTFVSDPGKKNGLYWAVKEGQAASPLGQLGDFGKAVASSGGERPPLFNGYYYRMLSQPDGFAILAYPAEYRNSGIMSFIVGKDGAVYQKDLGEKTGEEAVAMTDFNRAGGWTPILPQTGSAARAQ